MAKNSTFYAVQVFLPGYDVWVFHEEIVEHSSLQTEQRPAIYSTPEQALEIASYTDHMSRVVKLSVNGDALKVIKTFKHKRGT